MIKLKAAPVFLMVIRSGGKVKAKRSARRARAALTFPCHSLLFPIRDGSARSRAGIKSLGKIRRNLGRSFSGLGCFREHLAGNQGERIPLLGETILELGQTVPVLGEGIPLLGETIPDLGESVPNLGERIRQLGGTIPDQGETVPMLGETETIPQIGKGS